MARPKTARGAAARQPGERRAPRRCRGCGTELGTGEEARWECECGVSVCREDACFEEYFKLLADGESTRCRSCGNVL